MATSRMPNIQGDDFLQTYQLQRALLRAREGGGDKSAWAKALMQQGASTAPVRSPVEGLARMLSAGVGGYFSGQAGREGEASEQEMLAQMIGQRDQTRQAETAQLAQAGVPGFSMPMPQPAPGEAIPVPVAPAGGGDVVMPPNMPQAPAQPPARPVDAELIAALSGLAGQGNRTAAGALPGMQFQYQDAQAKEREARQEAAAAAREARMAAAASQPKPPAPTEMERTLAAAGMAPGSPEFQALMRQYAEQKAAPRTPLSSVTVNPNPPSDHRAVYDENNRLSHYEVIPGSPTAKKQQKEQFSDEDAALTADQTTGLIDNLLQHPALKQGTGGTGVLLNRIPGTPTYDFGQRVEQLQGRAFLQAFESLKGGGQITEVEGKKATQAIARLSTAQSEPAFREALTELRDITAAARDRILSRRQPAGGVAIPGTGLRADPPPGLPPGFRVVQ
jgi:hypothetical protein